MIPLKPIREILKQDCPYHVSNEAVILLRDKLEEIAWAIKQESIKEFERYNNYRRTQGLSPKKRLNRWAIMKGHHNALKQKSDNGMGLQSNGAVSPGDEMPTDKVVTKSAKRDNAVEVQ